MSLNLTPKFHGHFIFTSTVGSPLGEGIWYHILLVILNWRNCPLSSSSVFQGMRCDIIFMCQLSEYFSFSSNFVSFFIFFGRTPQRESALLINYNFTPRKGVHKLGVLLSRGQILSSWLRHKVDSGIGSSYWPASLCIACRAGKKATCQSRLDHPSQGLRIWLLGSSLAWETNLRQLRRGCQSRTRASRVQQAGELTISPSCNFSLVNFLTLTRTSMSWSNF